MKWMSGGLMGAVALLLGCSGAAAGEQNEFILPHGGRVVGEDLNVDKILRKTYEIETPSGVRITLDRSQVQTKRFRRPEEIEYEKIWPRYADTLEDQWTLAEWCRERSLSDRRKRHLKRVLELDPNHEKARRALGYIERRGEWTTRKEEMTARGYVLYEGQWRLPQEIELIEEERRIKAVEGNWQRKLDRWQDWMEDGRAGLASQQILEIDDPFAVKALALALKDEDNPQRRLLYVEALANIGTPPALKIIALWSLEDPIEEVRLTCLDHLKGQREAVAYLIGKLTSENNSEINRAAFALKHMGNRSAIRPLIDALVTTHRYKIKGKNPGQMTTGFNKAGGGGFAFGGGGAKIVTQKHQNRPVLEALVTLAGGPNFGFDVTAWKAWYASQRRSQQFDARRD